MQLSTNERVSSECHSPLAVYDRQTDKTDSHALPTRPRFLQTNLNTTIEIMRERVALVNKHLYFKLHI